jgi:hypothetical protein
MRIPWYLFKLGSNFIFLKRERERIWRSVGTWELGRVGGQGLDKFS